MFKVSITFNIIMCKNEYINGTKNLNWYTIIQNIDTKFRKLNIKKIKKIIKYLKTLMLMVHFKTLFITKPSPTMQDLHS